MRTMLLLPALLLSVGVSAEAPAPAPAERFSPPPPVLRDRGEMTDPSTTPVCRDRIDKAREERGLPKLDQDTAKPVDPLYIAAVDKRIGGCSVLVMRNNLSDIRPLPEFHDNPAQLIPLKGQ
jgi:hypothetical protein